MKQRFSGRSIALYHDSVPTTLYGTDAWWRDGGEWYRVAHEAGGFAWYWLDHGLAPWNC